MTPSMDSIKTTVCRHFGVQPIIMTSRRRARVEARPRQIAMYLCRTLTDESYPQIGRAFARDHTTVISAERKVRELISADPGFAATVKKITTELMHPAVTGVERAEAFDL